MNVVADVVRVVAPFRLIEDPDIRIPHDVGEAAHKHNIPLEAPVPFEISTVSPRATNGFNCAAADAINNPDPMYVGASVFCNVIAKLELFDVNLLDPNHVCKVDPVDNVFFPK